jgi:UDP-N-acetyl-D-mannosaminuronate dehydrogenase
VIQAANSQPYSHIHNPGIAVGGHCIPIYPQFYLWGDPDATIVSSARKMNSQMPYVVAHQVDFAIQKVRSPKILVLGATYRAEVPELAFSGVFPLVETLKSLGHPVEVFDPLIDEKALMRAGLPPLISPWSEFGVVIVQNESEIFKAMMAQGAKWTSLELIFDGRNLFDGISPLEGVGLHCVGRGSNKTILMSRKEK